MIVFILMAIKIIAGVFQVMFPELSAVATASPLMPLLLWMVSGESAELQVFESGFLLVLYALYLLVLLVAPWLTTAKNSRVAIVGLALVIVLNLLDVVTCLLSALDVWVKVSNVMLSALVIGLSIWKIREEL